MLKANAYWICPFYQNLKHEIETAYPLSILHYVTGPYGNLGTTIAKITSNTLLQFLSVSR